MIDTKAIIDAYAHIRATNSNIPDDVLDFMKKAAVDALNPIVFDDGNVRLAIGDSVTLTPPDKEDSFWKSNSGKYMAMGINDKIHVTVKQKPWLSIYYEITVSKDGKVLTKREYYDAMYPDEPKSEPTEDNSLIYTETDESSMFLRYVIGKGAKKD